MLESSIQVCDAYAQLVDRLAGFARVTPDAGAVLAGFTTAELALCRFERALDTGWPLPDDVVREAYFASLLLVVVLLGTADRSDRTARQLATALRMLRMIDRVAAIADRLVVVRLLDQLIARPLVPFASSDA